MKDYTEKDNLYCYKGTVVLKNRLNITDYERLARAEDEITSVNLAQLQQFVFEDELNYGSTAKRSLSTKIVGGWWSFSETPKSFRRKD